MKTLKNALMLAALAGLLAGCSTVDSRIKEKQNVFDTLTPAEQASIKQGIVAVGYTQDMVYMALGRADTVREHTTAEGTRTIWVYNAYYRDYQGRAFVGYHRSMYFDPYARVWRVYYMPVSASVYEDRVEEVGRVIFKDGRVESIEQTK